MKANYPILILCCALTSFGCSFGAETQPLRLPRKASLPEAVTPYDLKMVLVVSRDKGQSTRGITVSATSGGNRITKQIGSSGAVSLTLPYTPRDPVDFEFRLGSHYWVQRTSGIPVGAATIKVYFQLDDSGQITFSRMEY